MCDYFYTLHQKQELDEVKYFLLQHKHYLGEELFSKHFQKLYKDISEISFPFKIKKFSQKLYHVLNMDIGIWKLGLCKMCGKRCNFKNFSIGYSSYCCCKCAGSHSEVKEKNKLTNILLHGEDYASKRSKKGKETFLLLGEESKQKMIERIKQTKLKRFGCENYNNSNKQKKTMIEKYGGVGFASETIKEKYLQTLIERYNDTTYRNKDKNSETLKNLHKIWKEDIKIENNSTTSLLEIKIYDFLIKTFGKDFVIPQYKSEKYPFFCDFYIKSLDLYIEINGHPSHGKHPFEKDSVEDLQFVNFCKMKNSPFFNKIIEVWTIRDVEKRNLARKNNVNLLEVFSSNFDECKDIINNYINNDLICQKLVR